MSRQLHIVSLDVPYPPDYGGAIDIYYKIKALAEAGIDIHLHYFSYNERGQPDELNQLCRSVHVYGRKTGHKGFSLNTPYIISSRMHDDLVRRLNEDRHPILLEGLHCTGFLDEIDLESRRVVVRLHNRESEYYQQQVPLTRNLFKKLYFRHESRLLKKYESALPKNCFYACITEKDAEHLKTEHGEEGVFHLPVFTGSNNISSQEGMGTFSLYHGNLSVPENEKAASWLLTRVFSRMHLPLVIAGKNPSRRLQKLAHLCQHTCLIANPSAEEMQELIQKAHINILPAFTTSGIKIKLLKALFEGRHCITNDKMLEGTGLAPLCHSANSSNAMAAIVMQLHRQPFGMEEVTLRNRLLANRFSDEKNVRELIPYLW